MQRDELDAYTRLTGSIYACVRVTDLPLASCSEKRTCDLCHEPTWFDPNSYALVAKLGDLRGDVKVICTVCLREGLELQEAAVLLEEAAVLLATASTILARTARRGRWFEANKLYQGTHKLVSRIVAEAIERGLPIPPELFDE
jgi:sirohydrochlorin ferrochelatase